MKATYRRPPVRAEKAPTPSCPFLCKTKHVSPAAFLTTELTCVQLREDRGLVIGTKLLIMIKPLFVGHLPAYKAQSLDLRRWGWEWQQHHPHHGHPISQTGELRLRGRRGAPSRTSLALGPAHTPLSSSCPHTQKHHQQRLVLSGVRTQVPCYSPC